MMKYVPGQKNKQTNKHPEQCCLFPFSRAESPSQVKRKRCKRNKSSHWTKPFSCFSLLYQSQGSSSLTDGRQDFYCSWTQTTYRVARAYTQTLLGNLFFGDFTLFLVLHHLWGTSTLMCPPHHFLSHHFLFILWPHDALTEAGKWPGCWTKLFQ